MEGRTIEGFVYQEKIFVLIEFGGELATSGDGKEEATYGHG